MYALLWRASSRREERGGRGGWIRRDVICWNSCVASVMTEERAILRWKYGRVIFQLCRRPRNTSPRHSPAPPPHRAVRLAKLASYCGTRSVPGGLDGVTAPVGLEVGLGTLPRRRLAPAPAPAPATAVSSAIPAAIPAVAAAVAAPGPVPTSIPIPVVPGTDGPCPCPCPCCVSVPVPVVVSVPVPVAVSPLSCTARP